MVSTASAGDNPKGRGGKRFHVNWEGNIAPCHANLRPCKYGGESGSDWHFDNEDDARKAYEKYSEAQKFSPVQKRGVEKFPGESQESIQKRDEEANKIIRGIITDKTDNVKTPIKKTTTPKKRAAKKAEYDPWAPKQESVTKKTEKPLGMRELTNIAKTSNNTDDLMEAAVRGSANVQSYVITNPSSNAEILLHIRNNAKDERIGKNAIRHPNFPVKEMNSEEFVRAVQANGRNAINTQNPLMSDDVDDEKFNAYMDHIEKDSQYGVSGLGQAVMIANNPNNKVSKESVKRIIPHLENGSQYASLIHGGKLTVKDYVVHNHVMNENDLQDISRVENHEATRDLTEWVTSSPAKSSKVSETLINLAKNKNTSSQDLEKLYNESNKRLNEDSSNELGHSRLESNIYNNPNASAKIKKEILSHRPDIQRIERTNQIIEKNPNIKEQLVIDGTGQTQTLGRSYTQNSVQINTDKIKELGLSDREVTDVLARIYGNNVSASYANGVYTGRTDSSD